MPWKTINGNEYYYRQRREGDRIVSEYLGNGSIAEMTSEVDAIKRQERQEQRQWEQAERQQHKALRDELDAYGGAVRTLLSAVLVDNGYHTHKGQWRRRRERK